LLYRSNLDYKAANFKAMYKREDNPTPPLWLALIPILVTGLSLGFSVFLYEAEPHFSLLLGAAAAGVCAYAWGWLKRGSLNQHSRLSMAVSENTLPSAVSNYSF